MTGYADALLLRLNRAVDVGVLFWYSPAKHAQVEDSFPELPGVIDGVDPRFALDDLG